MTHDESKLVKKAMKFDDDFGVGLIPWGREIEAADKCVEMGWLRTEEPQTTNGCTGYFITGEGRQALAQ